MCLYLQRRVRAWSHLLRIPHFRCFRQIANRLCRDQIRGVLKDKPWVTPWLTVNGLDLKLFLCTNCCLSVWQLSNQDRASEETSRVLSLANRILCWVLSNVLLRSSIEMPVTFFLSTAVNRWLVKRRPSDLVEWCCLLPLWWMDILLFKVKQQTNWSWTTRSNTSDKTGNSDMRWMLLALHDHHV